MTAILIGEPAAPAELPFTLCGGDHREADVVVSIPARTRPGLYPVRAQLCITGDGVPAAWRQVVEDVCVVEVGATDDTDLIYLVDGPAEIRLAKAIAGGRKLAEVARLLGVSTETARAHLKSVFAKSGAHSQSELSVLLDRMAGPQDDR